jgi:hypothetical protein
MYSVMRLWIAVPLALALPLLAGAAPRSGTAPRADDGADAGSDAAPAKDPEVPACITVSAYVVNSAPGFDHVVRLASRCEQAAHCVVRTDVAPERIDVDVPSHEMREVVTFRGAPGPAFQARVKCRLEE